MKLGKYLNHTTDLNMISGLKLDLVIISTYLFSQTNKF